MDRFYRPTRQGGFTLVELSAVIAIVGTLSAVALPRYAGMMRSARVAKMEMAHGAVGEAARIYRMKWMLAGSPATASVIGEVEMNGKGWPTAVGIVVAAGLSEHYDTRLAGVIAADADHPDCSLAYMPETGAAVPSYRGASGC